MSPESAVEVHDLGDSITVVSASGEHDLATAPQLDQALTRIEEGGTIVILDLTAATFIDSSIITTAIRHAQLREQLLIVAPHYGQPRRTLDLVEAFKVLELFENRDDALRAATARERGGQPA
ncbi:MAG TPA: STAS domain-containing protein [Gaiellales bacterium]|nr:STAS domain-containing protein [Gaiellales bacterium]